MEMATSACPLTLDIVSELEHFWAQIKYWKLKKFYFFFYVAHGRREVQKMINARDVCQLSKNMTSFIIFNRNLLQESVIRITGL